MRLFGSLSFRLALIYAALFLVSVTALAGLYYWLGIHRPLDATRSQIRAESEYLAARYAIVGPLGLAPMLEERAGSASASQPYHALLRADGSAVVTNLPSWPRTRSDDWLRIDADVSREGEEDDYEALILDRELPDGGRLLLGRDIEDLERIEEAIAETGIWLMPALLFLVVAGGVMMSRAIGGRIEAVDAAARRVMEGDLSERVPVRGTGDDFDRLSTTLNLMLARIETSVDAVRRVSDSVAHELRTPLARLQAELGELETELPAASSQRLERAIHEAETLSRMFDAVLRISRIEAERHMAEMRALDLSSLLRDAAELYQPLAEERALAFFVQVAPDLWVVGDRDLLFQAFGNLLDNAIKFTPMKGRISLTAVKIGSNVGVAVTNSGPGIPDDLRDKLTERFFRAPSASNVPGFGLGLSLVAAIAARHRSELTFLPAETGLRVQWNFRYAGVRRGERDDQPR